MAEVVNMMMDAGMIVIVTARDVTKNQADLIQTIIENEMDIIWVGDEVTTNIVPTMHIKTIDNKNNIVKIKNRLKKQGIIFNI